MTSDVEFLHPGQFYTRLWLKDQKEIDCTSFVDRQIQYLKCRVFIVVLLSVGNIYNLLFTVILMTEELAL